MAVRYDPNNFPPSEPKHISFSSTAEAVFMQYDEETEYHVYARAIRQVGQEVGQSLMANVSDMDALNETCAAYPRSFAQQ